MKTVKRLERIGRALYGPQWQLYLAQDLKIDRATIARWLSGFTQLPEGHPVWPELRKIIAARIGELIDLLN